MKTKQPASPPTPARFDDQGLDRVIHERARLSVLTSLITNPSGLSFVDLKRLCDLTDGNLARHLQTLEKDSMVESSKQSHQNRTQNRTHTITRITPAGRKRYLEYLSVLEQVVRDAAVVEDHHANAQQLRTLSPIKV